MFLPPLALSPHHLDIMINLLGSTVLQRLYHPVFLYV